ncbi:MAG: dolichyl-phosphate beta-glucosyltransferase [Patescibacteria group bacterium]
MSKPFVSIIIPAYNESKRLPLTLIDIDRRLSERDYEYEIIVVSDGSRDETADIAERLSHVIKNLRVIANKENHGKGWVVRQGMLAAKGNWRLFTDADNSTSIEQFDKMVPYFKEGYGVVIGSRGIKGAELHPPQQWYKQILGKMGNLFIQILVLWGIQDTQCGFKCFSEEVTEKVFPLMKIDRWGFDVEALVLAKEMGFRIKEIPVRWVNDFRSKVSMGAYISTLLEVVKIRWWLWRKQYALEKK